MTRFLRKVYKIFTEDISTRKRLILANILLIATMIAIIGSVMYVQLNRKLYENEARFLHQNLESTAIILTNYFDNFVSKSDVIFSNTIMQKAIDQDYSDKTISDILLMYNNDLYKTIDPVMNEVYLADFFDEKTTRIKSIHLPKAKIYVQNETLPIDGGLIMDYAAIQHEAYVDKTVEADGGYVWRGRYNEKGVDYISLNRQLKNFDTLESIGLISIMIPINQLEYFLTENNDGYNMRVYLFDDNNQIIENRNNRLLFEEDYIVNLSKTLQQNDLTTVQYEGQSYLSEVINLDIIGWQLLAIYPYDTIEDSLKPFQLLIGVILLVGLVISIFISLLMANTMTVRLDMIVAKMNKLKINRHQTLKPIGGKDEIGHLDTIFNNMIMEMNTLVANEVTHELEHSKLEVELLQSQINPHILYNTLAVLSYKAKKIGEIEINEVTDKLIRFFKFYLNSGSLMSDVASELEMIDYYVDIIQYTYNIEVSYIKDVDESLNQLPILNLILQPIVENALIHGLKPSGQDKELTIYGRKIHDCIYIEVSDNGIGMNEERLEQLRNGDESVSRAGYGLSNVTKRIQLYFGEGYNLKISSVQGEGTKVSIELPVMGLDKQL